MRGFAKKAAAASGFKRLFSVRRLHFSKLSPQHQTPCLGPQQSTTTDVVEAEVGILDNFDAGEDVLHFEAMRARPVSVEVESPF
jgi:hypothetical protein